jgi:hypothetical protein
MAPIIPQPLRLAHSQAGDAGASLWSGAATSAASSFKHSEIDGSPSERYSAHTQLGTGEPTNNASLLDLSDIIARPTIGREKKSVPSRAQTEFGDGGESDVVEAGSTLTGRSGETDDELRHRNCDPLLEPVTAGCPHVEYALKTPIQAEEALSLEHIKTLIPRKGGGGKGGGGSSGGKNGGGSPNKPGSGGNGGPGTGSGGSGSGSGNAGSGDSNPPDAESEKKKTKMKIKIGAGIGGPSSWW